MSISFTVRVTGKDKLRRLADRFAAAASTLQDRLAREVQKESRTALSKVQTAWMGVEVTSTKGGGSSSGLRARVAAATLAQPIGQGSRFRVQNSQVDLEYGRALVLGLDNQQRWRHPVFGNRSAAAWRSSQQTGQEVFYKTLTAHEPQWRSRLEQLCDRVAQEIEG